MSFLVCRNCGTESRGDHCAKCGAPIVDGAFGIPDNVPRDKKGRRKKRPIRMGAVFRPALALLLPLVYLFADVFVVFTPELYGVTDTGASKFQLLFERLSSNAFDANPLEDLVSGVYGFDTEIYRTVSLWTMLKGEAGEMALPITVTVILALFSAAMGVMLLITAGRFLRSKLMTDLVLLGGTAGAMAPIVGNLMLRFHYTVNNGGFAGADEAMRYVGFSIESLIMIGIAVTLTIPSVLALRRVASAAHNMRYYVPLPCRLFPRIGFGLAKIISLVLALIALLVSLSYFVLPVLMNVGDLLGFSSALSDVVPDFISQAKAVCRMIIGNADLKNELPALCAPFVKFVFFLQIPLMFFALLGFLASFLPICFVQREKIYDRKCDRRAVKNAAHRFRRPVLTVFVCYTALQVALTLILLLASHVTTHLDFSSVDNTLGVVYLLIAYVKELCGTNTLYAFLAAVGTVAATVSGDFALQLYALGAPKDKPTK